MEWQGGYDARENMGYAWYEEDYGNYQGSYQEGYYGYENEYVEEIQEGTNYFGNQWDYNNNFEYFNNNDPSFSYENPNWESPQDQDYFHQAQAYQQELSYQEHEFQPWDSIYQDQDAHSNQLAQDFDIIAMIQQIMEDQEMGEREMEKNFKEMQSQLDQVTSTVQVLESQLAQVESSSKVQDESKTSEILEGEKNEELRVEDSLEVALLVERIEYGLLRGDPNGFESMIDESEDVVVEECLEQGVTELPKDEESTEENHEGSAHEESWSELKAPKPEITPLPKGLRYVFLGPNSTYPVIVNDACDDEVKWLLIELSENRKAMSFSLNDVQSISHSLRLHYTHLEKESRTFIELQNGLNPNLLNAFAREEYFSLPFIDKTLERLGNYALYCSLLGVILPILCRLLWWLTLLLLALLVSTKLKLFPGDKG